jgi:hypothetical protein
MLSDVPAFSFPSLIRSDRDVQTKVVSVAERCMELAQRSSAVPLLFVPEIFPIFPY